MRKILEKLATEQGVTILISSHILSELQLLATKYGFIHKVRLIKEISTDELLQSSETKICIRTADSAATAEILKVRLNIESISITETGEIQIPKENTNLEDLMSLFLKQGILIEGINLSVPNLEDYYMDLIGGYLKDSSSATLRMVSDNTLTTRIFKFSAVNKQHLSTINDYIHMTLLPVIIKAICLIVALVSFLKRDIHL